MKNKMFKMLILTLGILGLIALNSTAFAGYGSKEPAAEAPTAAAPEAPAAAEAQISGMDEAMMAKMKEFTTPNENHKLLEYFAGNWDYSMKWWMSADAPAEESVGTSNGTSIHGGRFIEQFVNGTSMGQPFEGRGIWGYDNVKKQFISLWFDNMGTGFMTSTSTYDETTKTFSEQGSHSCPLAETGVRTFTSTLKIIDDNSYSYEMFTNDPAGNQFKTMEIIYKRKS